MRTVISPCEEGSVATVETSGGEDTAPATITTTLYDLIAALQEVVEPGEGGTLSCAPSADAVAGNGASLNWRPSADAVAGKDRLVVATMVSMLRAGRIRRVVRNAVEPTPDEAVDGDQAPNQREGGREQ